MIHQWNTLILLQQKKLTYEKGYENKEMTVKNDFKQFEYNYYNVLKQETIDDYQMQMKIII